MVGDNFQHLCQSNRHGRPSYPTQPVNERGQYGSRPRGAAGSIATLALHVAAILLAGLGFAYLLIRWSGV